MAGLLLLGIAIALYSVGVFLALFFRGWLLTIIGTLSAFVIIPFFLISFLLGGMSGDFGYAGLGLGLLFIKVGPFAVPALGFICGWIAKVLLIEDVNSKSPMSAISLTVKSTFKNTGSNENKSIWGTILGIFIILWPIPIGVTATIKQQARKKFVEKKRVENERRWEKQKTLQEAINKAESELYAKTQKGRTVQVNLADQALYLRPFKYLSINQEDKNPHEKTITLWGNSMAEFIKANNQNNNAPEIYRVKIRTNTIKDSCPNTDPRTADIWCGEIKVANVVNYRPAKLGLQAFNRDLKRRGQHTKLSFYPNKQETTESSQLAPLIPMQPSGQIWRLKKTNSLQYIYSDIYVSCGKLSDSRVKNYGGCYVGFLLSEDIFVNMFVSTTQSKVESNAISSIEQAIKYWKQLKQG